MPTYEFRCPDGHTFDRFYRKISDAATEVECPECGKVATRQLSAGAGLLFKGSGFYLTDYGKNAHRGTSGTSGTSGESKAGNSASSSGESSGGGEAKPAAAKPESSGDSSQSSKADGAKTGPSTGGSTKSEN